MLRRISDPRTSSTPWFYHCKTYQRDKMKVILTKYEYDMFIRFTRRSSIRRQSKLVTKDNSSLENSQGLLVSKRMFHLAMSNFNAFDKVVKLKIQEYSCNISQLSLHDRKSCKYTHSSKALTKSTFKNRINVWNGILLVL